MLNRNKKLSVFKPKAGTPIPNNPEEALLVLQDMLNKKVMQQKTQALSNGMASTMLSKQFGLDSGLVNGMLDIRQQEELMQIAALKIAITTINQYNQYDWDEEEKGEDE